MLFLVNLNDEEVSLSPSFMLRSSTLLEESSSSLLYNITMFKLNGHCAVRGVAVTDIT